MANISGASLTPIYERLNSAPTYHPLEANTFADWALEAGDIVAVTRDGKTYNSPVNKSKVVWKGKQQVEISATGSKERESRARVSQRKYAQSGNGISNYNYLNSKIDIADSNISILQSNISVLESNISILNSNISTIESNISILNSNISTIKSNITAINSNISSIQSNITALNSNVSVINSNISVINGVLSVMAANISTIQSCYVRTVDLAADIAAISEELYVTHLNTQTLYVQAGGDGLIVNSTLNATNGIKINTGDAFSDCIVSLSASNNTLTWVYASGDTGSFSKAVSPTGATWEWEGGGTTIKATLTPTGDIIHSPAVIRAATVTVQGTTSNVHPVDLTTAVMLKQTTLREPGTVTKQDRGTSFSAYVTDATNGTTYYTAGTTYSNLYYAGSGFYAVGSVYTPTLRTGTSIGSSYSFSKEAVYDSAGRYRGDFWIGQNGQGTLYAAGSNYSYYDVGTGTTLYSIGPYYTAVGSSAGSITAIGSTSIKVKQTSVYPGDGGAFTVEGATKPAYEVVSTGGDLYYQADETTTLYNAGSTVTGTYWTKINPLI